MGAQTERVLFVKKLKADGTPCRKCAEVAERLEKAGLAVRIDRVVVADERDPASEGMQLAARHGVDAAPFFVVEREGAEPVIYTSWVKLLKEVLERPASAEDEAREILERNDDLDFL